MAPRDKERGADDVEALEAYKDAVKGATAPRFMISLLKEDESRTEASNRRREEGAKARKLEADAKRAEDENDLRKMLGKWALRFVGFQIFVCDLIVGVYVGSSVWRGSSVPVEVLVGWMTSSLVEIIGILWVIARSLFPFRDEYRDQSSEER